MYKKTIINCKVCVLFSPYYLPAATNTDLLHRFFCYFILCSCIKIFQYILFLGKTTHFI